MPRLDHFLIDPVEYFLAMKAPEPVEEADSLLKDWALLFPPDLSDEAAAVLHQCITAWASLVESRYRQQISRHRHPSPLPPKEPF